MDRLEESYRAFNDQCRVMEAIAWNEGAHPRDDLGRFTSKFGHFGPQSDERGYRVRDAKNGAAFGGIVGLAGAGVGAIPGAAIGGLAGWVHGGRAYRNDIKRAKRVNSALDSVYDAGHRYGRTHRDEVIKYAPEYENAKPMTMDIPEYLAYEQAMGRAASAGRSAGQAARRKKVKESFSAGLHPRDALGRFTSKAGGAMRSAGHGIRSGMTRQSIARGLKRSAAFGAGVGVGAASSALGHKVLGENFGLFNDILQSGAGASRASASTGNRRAFHRGFELAHDVGASYTIANKAERGIKRLRNAKHSGVKPRRRTESRPIKARGSNWVMHDSGPPWVRDTHRRSSPRF